MLKSQDIQEKQNYSQLLLKIWPQLKDVKVDKESIILSFQIPKEVPKKLFTSCSTADTVALQDQQ